MKRYRIAALVLMTLTLVPVTALAADETVGDFVVTSASGSGYTYRTGDNALVFDTPGSYTVSMRSGVTTTNLSKIQVDGGTSADPINITLNNVSINLICAFDVKNTSYVNLILAASTTNTLVSGDNYPGIRCLTGATLNISGDGTVNATGGNNGAGIGGGRSESSGSIKIVGGTVNATGGGAGIGGAGIGGGYHGNGEVTITGGTVNATGRGAGVGGAGIGGGYHGNGEVTITGGTVNATGGDNGAGIGDGAHGNGEVTITGGTVNATGGSYGAGVGGAYGNVEVTITGGTVNATGGYEGAGIGKGSAGAGTISITGGTVFAGYGSSKSKDIDSGTAGSDNSVVISDSAAVFLRHGSASITAPTTTTHTHYNYVAGTTTVYGVSVPSAWTGAFGAYLRVCALSYDANGGSGAAPLQVSQLYGTTTSAASGGSMTLEHYAFTGWNTAADGSGTTYSAGDTYTFTGEETLFAQWHRTDGREVELRTDSGYIQWRYEDDTNWQNLIPLSDITGAAGATGAAGTDGRDVELRTDSGYIQWRYAGDTGWQNLVVLSDITGAKGDKGDTGANGEDGVNGANGKNGTNGEDGLNGTNGIDGRNGADGNGIASIAKTGTQGNVDTYTITFTNGTSTTFTVTNGRDGVNGKDGAGISGNIDENGMLVLTLTDGTKLNMGKFAEISDGAVPASGAAVFGQRETDPLTIAAPWIAIAGLGLALLTFLSHLGVIPLPHRKK